MKRNPQTRKLAFFSSFLNFLCRSLAGPVFCCQIVLYSFETTGSSSHWIWNQLILNIDIDVSKSTKLSISMQKHFRRIIASSMNRNATDSIRQYILLIPFIAVQSAISTRWHVSDCASACVRDSMCIDKFTRTHAFTTMYDTDQCFCLRIKIQSSFSHGKTQNDEKKTTNK